MKNIIGSICLSTSAFIMTTSGAHAEDYIQFQVNAVAAGYSWDADEDILYGNGNESGVVAPI